MLNPKALDERDMFQTYFSQIQTSSSTSTSIYFTSCFKPILVKFKQNKGLNEKFSQIRFKPILVKFKLPHPHQHQYILLHVSNLF